MLCSHIVILWGGNVNIRTAWPNLSGFLTIPSPAQSIRSWLNVFGNLQMKDSETSIFSILFLTPFTILLIFQECRVSSSTVFFAEYCTVPFFGIGEITVPQSASIVLFFWFFVKIRGKKITIYYCGNPSL